MVVEVVLVVEVVIVVVVVVEVVVEALVDDGMKGTYSGSVFNLNS